MTASAEKPIPETMNAVVLDQFGGVDELSLRQIPVPTIGDDDVLIRVESAGLGSWDPSEREGEFASGAQTFPYVLGWDGAGTIAAVGRNVTRFAPGDRVYAGTYPEARDGFYAEFVAVEAEFTSHIPDKLTTQQAGIVMWDALTALGGLATLDAQSGHAVMIFGASGGVGHFAVQFARVMGVRVLAVASGQDGVALVERLGAEAAVDGRRDDVVAVAQEFAPGGIDAALVLAGGDVAERALGTLKDGGRVAVPTGVEPVPATKKVLMYDADRTKEGIDRLNALIESASFEVNVAQTFPLAEATEAHRALSGHHLGKMALEFPQV